MRLSHTATVILLPAIQKFIALLPQADKAEVLTELKLAQNVEMLGTHFHHILAEPALWALNIAANGHNWCILAYLEHHQVEPHYLVCTHVFKQTKEDIPRHELDKALKLFLLSQQMGGV